MSSKPRGAKESKHEPRTAARRGSHRSAQHGGFQMSLNLVTLLYLVASVCFIQAL